MIGFNTKAMMNEVSDNAQKFLTAKPFIDLLKQNTKYLTRQQYSTLRGQALAGDVEGAHKGLQYLIRRRT